MKPYMMMVFMLGMACAGIGLAYYGPDIAIRSLGEGAAVLFFGLFLLTLLFAVLVHFGCWKLPLG